MASTVWAMEEDWNSTQDYSNTTTARPYYVPGHLAAESITANTAQNVQWIFALVLIPCVSLPGILGNVSSLMILYRHGFKKTSNILLAALTLADACYLIGVNNVASFIHQYSSAKGLDFSVNVCYFLYALFRIYFLLELWGNWCSLTIPLLITLERLVAVYYPFRFPVIVTPSRTWLTVTILYIMCLPMNVYYCFLEELIFVNDTGVNKGLITRTKLYTEDKYVYKSVAQTAMIITEPIPVLLVVTGCIMVALRVRRAAVKRRKMVSAVASVLQQPRTIPAFRTTWTLMLVCILYTCTIGTAFIIQLIMNKEGESNLDLILETLVRFVKCLHSSCNFFIYIYVNRNFRDTYRNIFGSFINGTRRAPSETSRSG